MSRQPIITKRKGPICILKLNQPDQLNAITYEMTEQFGKTIEELKADATLRVLIVTGSGRSFSAGGDLDVLEAAFGAEPVTRKKNLFEFYNRFLSIRTLRVPTIAAINGYAIGAGACLAMACNMRIAAESARIGFTFAKLGLHPGMGAEYFLLNTVGEAKTYELLMTGDVIPAVEGYRIGLINQVVADDALIDKTMELAAKICAIPDSPINMMKDSIPSAKNGSLEDTLHRQASYQAINFMSEDFKKAIKALKEKQNLTYQDN